MNQIVLVTGNNVTMSWNETVDFAGGAWGFGGGVTPRHGRRHPVVDENNVVDGQGCREGRYFQLRTSGHINGTE